MDTQNPFNFYRSFGLGVHSVLFNWIGPKYQQVDKKENKNKKGELNFLFFMLKYSSQQLVFFSVQLCRLFKQFLLLVFVSQMASGLFRAISATCRNMIMANTFGSFVMLLLFALGGFVLSRGTVN